MSEARIIELAAPLAPPLAVLGHHPTGLALPPGRPFPLGGEGRVLRLEQGRVEIYAAAAGRRHFLCEFGPGAVLFGAAGAHPLLALAPEGARLVAIDGPAPVRAEELAAWLDTWLLAVSAGLARFAPDRPELYGCQAPEHLDVAPGAFISAAQGVAWAECTPGQTLNLMGVAPTRLFPLTPATWAGPKAEAAQPVRVVCHSSAAAVLSPGWPHLLAGFHDQLVSLIDGWTEAAHHEESGRIARREALTAEDLTETARRLRGILLPDAPASTVPDDDAAFVTGIVAPGMEPPPADPARPPDVRAYAEAAGARTRDVQLTGRWWRSDRGKLAATRTDGRAVALTPDWFGRARIHVRGEKVRRVTAAIAARLDPGALSIMPPLPNRPVKAWEVVVIGFRLCRLDLSTMVAASAAASLLALLLPVAMSTVVDTFIPDQLRTGVMQLGAALVVLTVCGSLLKIVGDVARLRMDGRLSAAIQSGVMDRTLRFPSRLLRTQASADLAMRVMSVDQMRRMVTNLALNTIMNGLFGLSGFAVLFLYSIPAALIAIGLFVLLGALAVVAGRAQLRALAQGEAMTANVQSFTLQLIQNVSTLRAFAAERRAYNVWARNSAEMRGRSLRSRRYYLLFDAFVASYDTLALAAIFAALGYTAGADHLSTGAYLAFIATYQGFLMSSETLSRSVVQIMGAMPTLARAQMLLDNPPETLPSAKDPGRLSGAIEVSNAVFSYGPALHPVLNGVSLRIEAGSFVALCGPSGSGKSTLANLILGLDSPSAGAVLFDGQDMARLNRALVRRQIGVVRQSGRMIAGSIFENILGMHKGAMDDAWAAADLAGIGDDIRAMPMGMHTVLAEGVSTFSGGQVQRMLMARALMGKPRILLLDEATSALDNITQAAVTDRIERLGVTRIVIAHRLSTIRNADAIHFMEGGVLVESGSFDQLMQARGRFADFAARQTL